MQNRVSQIWIPGLVTLFSAYVSLALMQFAGLRVMISHPGEPRGIVLYLPWMLSLPLIGAIGAYLSGGRKQQDGAFISRPPFPPWLLECFSCCFFPWRS